MALGPLEIRVVCTLRKLRSATGREILDRLCGEQREITYSTVRTVLTRLHCRGIIDRRREVVRGSPRFVYFYRDLEREYVDHVVAEVVRTFGRSGLHRLESALAGLGEEDLSRLEQCLIERPVGVTQ